jgi:hypothetical protein
MLNFFKRDKPAQIYQHINLMLVNDDLNLIQSKVLEIFGVAEVQQAEQFSTILTQFLKQPVELRVKTAKADPNFANQKLGMANFIAGVPSARPKSQELLIYQTQFILSMVAVIAPELTAELLQKLTTLTHSIGGLIFIDGKSFLSSEGKLIWDTAGNSEVDFFPVSRLREVGE